MTEKERLKKTIKCLNNTTTITYLLVLCSTDIYTITTRIQLHGFYLYCYQFFLSCCSINWPFNFQLGNPFNTPSSQYPVYTKQQRDIMVGDHLGFLLKAEVSCSSFLVLAN